MVRTIKIDPKDNLIVALNNLKKGETVICNNEKITLVTKVNEKHKFSVQNLEIGDKVYMYGVIVGKAIKKILKGELINKNNISHDTEAYQLSKHKKNITWELTNFKNFSNKKFLGYHRDDGKVGTENNWLVIPLVFCQNRNIEELKKALLFELGFDNNRKEIFDIKSLIKRFENGATRTRYIK